MKYSLSKADLEGIVSLIDPGLSPRDIKSLRISYEESEVIVLVDGTYPQRTMTVPIILSIDGGIAR